MLKQLEIKASRCLLWVCLFCNRCATNLDNHFFPKIRVSAVQDNFTSEGSEDSGNNNIISYNFNSNWAFFRGDLKDAEAVDFNDKDRWDGHW